MRKILLLVFLIPSYFFAQEEEIGIQELTISQISTSEVNIYLKTICGTIFGYNTNNVTLINNIISINVCYNITGFIENVENIQNFAIHIPNNGSYTLNITCFTSNTSPSCNYFYFQDAASLNFHFPLNGTVSLSSTNFKDLNKKFVILPNPTTHSFEIKNNTNFKSISIYDNLGRQVKEFLKPESNYNITDLNSGIYYVRVKDNNGKVFEKKLVKQ